MLSSDGAVLFFTPSFVTQHEYSFPRAAQRFWFGGPKKIFLVGPQKILFLCSKMAPQGIIFSIYVYCLVKIHINRWDPLVLFLDFGGYTNSVTVTVFSVTPRQWKMLNFNSAPCEWRIHPRRCYLSKFKSKFLSFWKKIVFLSASGEIFLNECPKISFNRNLKPLFEMESNCQKWRMNIYQTSTKSSLASFQKSSQFRLGSRFTNIGR
jgi:hypothetical protein